MWRRSENIFCYYRTLFFECDTPYIGSGISSSYCPFGRPQDYDIVPIFKDLMDYYESKVIHRNKRYRTDNQKITDQIKNLQEDSRKERAEIEKLQEQIQQNEKRWTQGRDFRTSQQIMEPASKVLAMIGSGNKK